MKKTNDLLNEKRIFHLNDSQIIERAQIDAYNSAVRDVWKHVKLSTGGRMYQTHSPSQGVVTVTVDEQSVLGLIKDEL